MIESIDEIKTRIKKDKFKLILELHRTIDIEITELREIYIEKYYDKFIQEVYKKNNLQISLQAEKKILQADYKFIYGYIFQELDFIKFKKYFNNYETDIKRLKNYVENNKFFGVN